jgi:hypothetical protein
LVQAQVRQQQEQWLWREQQQEHYSNAIIMCEAGCLLLQQYTSQQIHVVVKTSSSMCS